HRAGAVDCQLLSGTHRRSLSHFASSAHRAENATANRFDGIRTCSFREHRWQRIFPRFEDRGGRIPRKAERETRSHTLRAANKTGPGRFLAPKTPAAWSD